MFDEKYITELISNRIEESPELEYKAALALQREDKKVMEITKDVSAFANSNGGVLIYGISEDKVNRNLPGLIDGVNRKSITKEWLEQIINSKIRPKINGIKIHVIPLACDNVVYVLEIPKGETAHQAGDKRYYRRHNFMVEPLLDHEIRDIMGRQKNAEITVDFFIRKGAYQYIEGSENNTNLPQYFWLDIFARNKGKVYAKYVNIVLHIPEKCLRGSNQSKAVDDLETKYFRNTFRDLVSPDAHRYYQGQYAKAPQYGPSRYVPVLPSTRLFIDSIAIHENALDAEDMFSWTVFADNAEPKMGSCTFNEVEKG